MSVCESFLLIDSDEENIHDDGIAIQPTKHNKRSKHRRLSHPTKHIATADQEHQQHGSTHSSRRPQKRLQKRRKDGQQSQYKQVPEPTSTMATQAGRKYDTDRNANKSSPPEIPDRMSSLSSMPITLSSFSEPSATSADTIKPVEKVKVVKPDLCASNVCIDMSVMNGDACHLLLNCPELCRNKYGRICMRIPPEHAPVITPADLSRHGDGKRYSIMTATFDAKVEQWLAAVGSGDGASFRSDETTIRKATPPPPPPRIEEREATAEEGQGARQPTEAVSMETAQSSIPKEHRRRGMHESDAVVQAYMRLCAGEQMPLA